MQIRAVAYCAVSVILSCGITQVVGTIALIYIAIQKIWNCRQRAYYESQLKSTQARNNKEFYEIYQHKIKYYEKRSEMHSKLAWVFFRTMCPVIGLPHTIHDYKSQIAKGVLFPFENSSLENIVQMRPEIDEENEVPKESRLEIFLLEYLKLKTLCKAETLRLNTADGRQLDVDWYPAFKNLATGVEHPPNGRTVILFDGNAGTKHTSQKFAINYLENDYNVVTLTIGGYPGSEQNVPMSEMTTVYDALAVAKYLLEVRGVPPNKLLSDGTSLGSTLACAVGAYVPGSHVLTQKAFTTPIDVAKNMLKKGSKIESTEKLIATTFPVGIPFPHPVVINGFSIPNLVTDGFNNLKKVGLFTGKYYAIASEQDEIMTRSDDLQKEIEEKRKRVSESPTAAPPVIQPLRTFPKSLSQDLVDQYRRTHRNVNQELISTYPGNHNAPNPDAVMQKWFEFVDSVPR